MGISNLIWLIYLINVVIILTIVCFQRRNPIASMAWIMLFLLLPAVGGIIFLIFGVGVNNLTNRKYRQKIETNQRYLLEKQKSYFFSENDEIPNRDIVNYLLNCGSVYTKNNQIEVFTDAKEKYRRLFEDIDNAKESVDLLYFIIRNDKVGNALIEKLVKKAEEGVRIRLLYDGFGSLFTPKRMFNKLRVKENSSVLEFFPVRFFSLSKINHRNHRKIAVIDGRISYIGGMNIGDEYANQSDKKHPFWRDTHLRIEGEATEYIERCFAMDWEFSSGEEVKIKRLSGEYDFSEKLPIQIVQSGPDSTDEEIKCGMIKLINNAKKYVYIQSPYFVPDPAFLTAVTMAAKSGIDVRVMIPGVPDKKYVYYTTMSYVGELLKNGVRVYLYNGFIHSKTVTADDAFSVGSTNTDIRSFTLHFEINAFIFNAREAEKHQKIFYEDIENSKEITLEEYNKRGIKQIVMEGFFRLLSPIM